MCFEKEHYNCFFMVYPKKKKKKKTLSANKEVNRVMQHQIP